MARISSDELAQQFIARGLTAQQGRLLTVKQAQFLFSLAREEAERAGHYGPFRARNGAPEISGVGWTLYVMKNGAGNLKED